MFQKFVDWFSCCSCKKKKSNGVEGEYIAVEKAPDRDKMTRAEKVLVGAILVTGIIDAAVFFANTDLFILTAGSTYKVTNIFWYIAQGLADKFSIFSLCVSGANAFQNLLFCALAATTPARAFLLSFKKIQISNYTPGSRTIDAATTSDSGGEDSKLVLLSDSPLGLFAQPKQINEDHLLDDEPKPKKDGCFDRCVIL